MVENPRRKHRQNSRADSGSSVFGGMKRETDGNEGNEQELLLKFPSQRLRNVLIPSPTLENVVVRFLPLKENLATLEQSVRKCETCSSWGHFFNNTQWRIGKMFTLTVDISQWPCWQNIFRKFQWLLSCSQCHEILEFHYSFSKRYCAPICDWKHKVWVLTYPPTFLHFAPFPALRFSRSRVWT